MLDILHFCCFFIKQFKVHEIDINQAKNQANQVLSWFNNINWLVSYDSIRIYLDVFMCLWIKIVKLLLLLPRKVGIQLATQLTDKSHSIHVNGSKYVLEERQNYIWRNIANKINKKQNKGKVHRKRKEKKTYKCQFCPYTYLRTVKTDIFPFFFL